MQLLNLFKVILPPPSPPPAFCHPGAPPPCPHIGYMQ
jgi:hypothetical protein